MANFVSLDNSIPEVGSSSGAERMTRSRARRNREERAATLARRTARARQSRGERAATREAHTLAVSTARARQSQGERAAT